MVNSKYIKKNKLNTKKKNTKKKIRKLQKGGSAGSPISDYKIELKERLNFFKDPDNPIINTNPSRLVKNMIDISSILSQQVYPLSQQSDVSTDVGHNKITLDGQQKLLFKYTKLDKTQATLETFRKNFEEFETFVSTDSQEPGEYNKYSLHTEMTISNMHGGMCSQDDKLFSVVPANTLICFTSPLDYLFTVSTQEQYNIGLNYSDMSAEMYVEIFKKHMSLRNMGFGDFKNDSYALPWYNCLVDSMWYYPGQVYPNLEFSVSHNDYKVDGKTQGIRFLNISTENPHKVIHMDDVKYYGPDKIYPSIQAQDSSIRYILNDLVDYNPRNKKFRVIIAICCRPIFTDGIDNLVKQKIIYHEIIFYHINKKIIEGYTIPITLCSDFFLSKCYSQTTKKYYLIHTKLFENNIFFDSPMLKNINLDSRIPSLMKIKNKINTHRGPDINITVTELTYIRSMSFKKLFLFITQLEPIHIKPLIRKLIQYFYTDINITSKKFIFGLRHHTYYHNQEPMFKYQHEMMKYMRKLSNLFLKESGMFNLFIEKNISRFLHDVESQKRHNTIFNSPVKAGETYEHILFDGVIYGDIDEQIGDLNANLESISLITLLESEDSSPTKPYSGVEKLILGKGFKKFTEGYSGNRNLLATIFTIFPNIRELVFRDCFNLITNSRNVFKLGNVRAIKLTSLILKNTQLYFDFNQFENLEYLEIENNPSIRFLNLENKKIKNVVLTNLKILSLLNVKKLKLDFLKLVNLNENINEVSIGEVVKLVIEESFPKNITKPKKILDLQLSDIRIKIKDLKDIIPVSGGFSFGKKKPKLVSLNFVNIILTEQADGNIKEKEKEKKKLIECFKGLNYLDLNFINFEVINSMPELIKFSNTDLLKLDKKTKVTIIRENFHGDGTSRKRDININ